MPGPEVRAYDSEASEPPLAVGSRLCTQCGLCCTGALHNYAVLEPGEIPIARDLGLAVRAERKPGFALPCPRLVDSKCSIYKNRPKVCSRYKCQLLEDVEAGTTGLESAIDKVVTAKELTAKAHSVMPNGMTLSEARVRVTEEPSAKTSPSGRAGDMRLKLAVMALCVYLDKHFRNSVEGKMLSLEPVAEKKMNTEMK